MKRASVGSGGLMLILATSLGLAACEGKQGDKASLPPAAPAEQKASEQNAAEQKPADAANAQQAGAAQGGAGAAQQQAQAHGAQQQGQANGVQANHAQPQTNAPLDNPAANGNLNEPGTTVNGQAQPQAQPTGYRLTGSVAAQRRSKLSFRVGGFIDQIVAKSGNVMKKDQVLATLDARDFEVRLDLAKAKRDQAKVALDNAAKEFQREKQLQKDSASTPTAFDKVQSAYEQAKLALKLAELDVVTAQNALDDTKLRAPYDAVVARQLKDVSENVQTGNEIYEIYDVGVPEITLEAPERLMGQIKVGDELTVQVPSANFSGKAKVTRLVNVINDKTRTFQVIVQLNEKNDRVVAGSYAEAVMD